MIRPEFRRFYGPAWRAYRLAMIEAHGNTCSVCGRHVTRYLNLCHLSHDPRSSSLAFMCAADHNRHDAGHRLAIRRRNSAKHAGQLWLWTEVQWDPYPVWQRPRRVIEMARPTQGELWAA